MNTLARNIPTSSFDPIAQKAAEWLVMLTSDDEGERLWAREGFQAWKQADPRHAAVAADMEKLIGLTQTVLDNTAGNSAPAHAALDTVFPSRKRNHVRRLGAALAIVFALATPAWLMLQNDPSHLLADLHTSTGQWQTHRLSDGTSITLNGASAVNLHYDAQRRTVELVKGEVLVDVAKDVSRPFIVYTVHGSIRALGTRFTVERQPADKSDSTVLTMLESTVSVQTAAQKTTSAANATIVNAGQRVRITRDGISPPEPIDSSSIDDAWRSHQLVVNNQPLTAVLDELGRYRSGLIQYDAAQLKGINVSAVLPLDDTDRALQLLKANFPHLRIRTFTPYLVMVDTPASP